MNWLVYHVVSGHAFFTGIVLLIGSSAASLQSRPWIVRLALPGMIIGGIAIVASSTPVPLWLSIIWLLALAAWCIARFRKKYRRETAFCVIAVAVIAACCEFPHDITPTLRPAPERTLTVIGDSITAGTGGDDQSETWPNIVRRLHGIEVLGISHMGDTAARALKRAKEHHIDSSVVVIEIGGNDILGTTTPEKFAHDLDALLGHLAAPDRQVVIFELPTPPFYHAYGQIQRHAAARYGVAMIPKRVFVQVISGSSSTLDSIHLSQSGHQLMAESVWKAIAPAYQDGLE